ncbi:flagellar hook-length control protein FliK [Marinobacter koreensis]|uniref:Flagellar hook-length control protein FliK n=2 Tax=Marinobacter koreensis TaxID=335974 RepID=A0ABW0RHT0_9GAMM
MKLPGNLPIQPSGQPSAQSGSSFASPLPAARQLLDQLQLRNNDTVLARVAEVIQKKGAPPELLLEVRNKPLLVEAALREVKVEPGDWLRVMRAGNELRLMGKLPEAPEATIARALAQRLPWQQSLGPGLATLAKALTSGLRPDPGPGQLPSMVTAQALPEPARQALEQVLARMPDPTSFKPGSGRSEQAPATIRQWLADSGLFAESQLARASETPAADLKLALMKVVSALLAQRSQPISEFNRIVPLQSPELLQAPLQFPTAQPAPAPAAGQSGEAASVGQTLKMLAGMLNRITVNQLHSQVLTTRAGGETGAPTSTMLLELPWLNAQQEPRVAQLRIEQNDREGSEADSARKRTVSEWRLNLVIDLDEAGPLHFDVAISQTSVGAKVWAERQSTLRQVNEQLPTLRKSLSDLGLEVTELESRLGKPRQTETRLEHRLVDTRA